MEITAQIGNVAINASRIIQRLIDENLIVNLKLAKKKKCSNDKTINLESVPSI